MAEAVHGPLESTAIIDYCQRPADAVSMPKAAKTWSLWCTNSSPLSSHPEVECPLRCLIAKATIRAPVRVIHSVELKIEWGDKFLTRYLH